MGTSQEAALPGPRTPSLLDLSVQPGHQIPGLGKQSRQHLGRAGGDGGQECFLSSSTFLRLNEAGRRENPRAPQDRETVCLITKHLLPRTPPRFGEAYLAV